MFLNMFLIEIQRRNVFYFVRFLGFVIIFPSKRFGWDSQADSNDPIKKVIYFSKPQKKNKCLKNQGHSQENTCTLDKVGVNIVRVGGGNKGKNSRQNKCQRIDVQV